MAMRFALSVLAAVSLLLMACGGAPATSPPGQPTTAPPGAALDNVVGRGSAGPEERELAVPQNDGVVDTGGLPTVVFVDADG